MSEQDTKAVFIDRKYQRNIIDVCVSRNSIIYLPTGAGKTYIAIQVIKHFSDSLKAKYSDGGKRSFFLVPTVALAKQQADRIKSIMPFNVGVLTGENNVDNFNAQEWLNVLNENEILVMTAECFKLAVAQTFINLKSVSVIVFDECHHGRKGHPYRQIMQNMKGKAIVNDIRIIGLSGILIGINNSIKPYKVPVELKQLEDVYQSTIITVNNIEDHKNVLLYSTKAKESFIAYESTPLDERLTIIKARVSKLREYLNTIQMNNNRRINPKTMRGQGPKKIKELIDLLKDFEDQTEALGSYGSYLALLSVLIQLKLKARFADTEKIRNIVKECITRVQNCINYLKHELGLDKKDTATIVENSSLKVRTLFLLLEKFFKDPNREKDMQCLIFTKRCSSAKILYHLIKCYGHDDPKSPLKPDFVVGRNSSMPESIESISMPSNNSLALKKFENKETNIIVCTNVLEEGIDLQACNLVIVYDPLETPRSYIQSRGRARDDKSNYVIMVDKESMPKFQIKFQTWHEIDFVMKQELIGRTIDRSPPTEEDIMKEQAQEWEPFFTNEGACLTALNCVPILNQYVQSLPGDNFTSASVHWKLKIDHSDGKFSVNLALPTQSMITKEISGRPQRNIKVAKQDAAFQACKILYFNGSLTEKLSPVDNKIKIEQCNAEYFDHWKKYDKNDSKTAGTKNNHRFHDIKIPEALSNCGPNIGSNFLYRISIKPKFDDGNNNALKVFYKLLANENTFGILTSKRIPKLSIIPLFQSFGEIECEISELPTLTDIESEESLQKLQNFHINIFRDLLKAFQNYIVLDKASYLIVPINGYNEIDWTLIDNFQKIPQPTQLTKTQIERMTFKAEDYINKVINPVYRQFTQQNYVVIDINHHKTPLSTFPNDNNQTYAEYIQDKYQMEIHRNDQFLIEVKGISRNLKLLFPGAGANGKQKKNERLIEYEKYIPEICHNYKFPADFWLKATLLPAICHRMTFLLLAEELRRWLIKEGIDNGCGQQMYKLDVDYGDYDKRAENLKQVEHEPAEKLDNFEDFLKKIGKLNDENGYKRKNFKTQRNLTWDHSAFPIDLDRNLQKFTDLDIENYFQFINKNKEVAENNSKMLKNKHESAPKSQPSLKEQANSKEIKLLNLNNFSSCIQQKDLIKVITTKNAGDVFDMERYETLGDGFLKFIASLFLYKTHADWHEGHLTALRGKMVSNRNLYYIGNDLGLSKILNAYQFDAQSSFAPSTKLPGNLKEILVKDKRLLTCLVHVKESLSDSEIKNGLMNDENLKLFKTVDGKLEKSIDTSFIRFINQKVIGDKAVADCVEALLGCTVSSVGIDATYKLCQKLKILPETKNLLSEKIHPRIVHESDLTLTNREILEKKISYKFTNEIYLTQALTHASYPNKASGTYQQLEFLGDAVLDFLITSFIFENCPKMDPGELTDLRSALVNNVTLACIIVRNDIHKHMLHENYALSEAIKKFVTFQESHDHKVTDQIELINTENDKSVAKSIEVPKALGDIFESIVGAIFLDTNLSLKKTWDVIYKLMNHEIYKFMYNIPIQITRRLFEFDHGMTQPKFYKTEIIDGDETVAVPLKIKTRDGIDKYFIGFGKNRKIAKEAAAKKALTYLM